MAEARPLLRSPEGRSVVGARLFAAACVAGALAVALGAFGAHALADAVPPQRLETWRTGASYHLAHALAAAIAAHIGGTWGRRASALFLGGVLAFSGSLYGLVLTGASALGAVAPVGGVLFMAGWVALALEGRGR